MAQNTLLVSYDLIGPETSDDYKELIKKIMSYPNQKKALESFWFVKTVKSASTVRDELKLHIDANDKIVVINITSDNRATFGLSNEILKWMHANL